MDPHFVSRSFLTSPFLLHRLPKRLVISTAAVFVFLVAGAWLLARGGGVSVPEQLTIMIEMSTQNATVGLLIALNLIGNVELVIPCVAYGLLMYGSATAMVAFGRRQHSALRAVEPQAAVA